MNRLWIPTELHTHSVHSDGAFSIHGLAEALRDAGFEAAALMDHNTISGSTAFGQALEDLGLTPIPGLELTTFYGHILSLGTTQYVEWRDATREDGLARMAQRIRAADGLCGLAHPFVPGGFLCTGCHLEYVWDGKPHMDYVEVWNGPLAHRSPFNRRAYRWWQSLLDAGIRVPAVAGQDWHRPHTAPDVLHAATYLGIPEGPVTTAKLLEALQAGRVSVSHGPVPVLEPCQGLECLRVHVLPGRARRESLLLRLIGPRAVVLAECPAKEGEMHTLFPSGAERVHAELWSDEDLIGFTSPAYASEKVLER